MIKKEPEILQLENLNSALRFLELNVDTKSEKYRKLAKKMRTFYFDESAEEFSTFFKVSL